MKSSDPAFPVGYTIPANSIIKKDGVEIGRSTTPESFTFEGLTKREYIALHILSGLATQQQLLLGNKELLSRLGTSGIDKGQAIQAVRLADALIEELERKPK